jgi:hypothetical protein
MKFVAIPPGAIGMVWHALKPGLDKCLKHGLGLTTVQDVFHRCADGTWMLFAMYEETKPVVVITAAIRKGEQGDVFDVGLCWGSRLDEWIGDVCQAFEIIGAESGCKYLAFQGRTGWHRLAKQHDFKVNSMTWVKEI